MAKKTKFARHAEVAQHVEEATVIHIGQVTNQATSPGTSVQKVSIPHEPDSVGGRPRNDQKPTIRLPSGYQVLRYKGKAVYTEDIGNQFIEAYYESGGSITGACRKAGVTFRAALLWRDTIPEFAMGLREVDEIIKDEIHRQFMTRVLHEWEANPSWKFKYFNKHFPEYSETKKSVKVSFQLKDSLIKTEDIVEGEVVKEQLETRDESGPKQLMEAPSNPS